MMFVRTLCIFVLFAHSATLNAGDRWNVRAMGMARTSVANSWGTEAIGINPANLAIPGRSPFSLSLFPIGVRMSTEMMSYDMYQEYFTGIPGTNTDGKRDPKVLTEQDKQNILSFLPDGLAATRADMEVMEIGATITAPGFGGIGAAIIDRGNASLKIPKDFTRFYLYGLDSAGSNYNFDGMSVSASWWREYNISYAYQYIVDSVEGRSLFIGIGVKWLRGYGAFETNHYLSSVSNQRVRTNQYLLHANFDYLTHRSGADFFDPDNNEDFTLSPDPAGRGMGYDVGVSFQMRPGFTVAASITDIGSIQWDRNVVKTDGRYSLVMDDPFQTESKDSLERAVRGYNQSGEAFSTSLPTTLRIGVAIETDEYKVFDFLPGKMLLAFDYTQGLNSSMGNATNPRLSLGVEYRLISFLPLRTGLSMGGGDGVRWAAGFGLDFHSFRFDVATENLGMVFIPKKTQMVSVAAGMRVLI